MGDKFCRLDINMAVEGRLVDLEIQVEDESDWPERSVFYWAKLFSSALPESGEYRDLPPTIVIGILAFKLFDCEEYHSEFRLLEVTRHEQLTDRMCLHFYELTKLPEITSPELIGEADEELLWLSLFRSKTDEDILKIQKKGGSLMEQVIEAYRRVSASDELKEIERMRERARHNEASALGNARRKARQEKTIEIAKAMKARGIEVGDIAEITNLTVDDILRL